MSPTKIHPTKKWEVSFMKFEENGQEKYKVTRRIPELEVAETKIVTSKKEARRVFEEWLR